MESDVQYLSRRAKEEAEAAEKADTPKVRELHRELADRYRKAADSNPPPHAPDGPAKPGLPDEFRVLD